MVAEDTVYTILYDKFMFWSIIVGIFTFGWMFIAILRFRAGVTDEKHLEEIEVGTFPLERENLKLEVTWFVVPTILVIWLTFLAFGSMNLVWAQMPDEDDAFNVRVEGYQWYWNYVYEDSLTYQVVGTNSDLISVDWTASGLVVDSADGEGVEAAITYGTNTEKMNLSAGETELNVSFSDSIFQQVLVKDVDGNVIHTWEHIPVGHERSDKLVIPCDIPAIFGLFSIGNSDNMGVQHAFWTPEWGNKEDLVPGLETGTKMFIQPDRTGTFPIRCAEYCGLEHSLMESEVQVVQWFDNGVLNNCEEDMWLKLPDGGDA